MTQKIADMLYSGDDEMIELAKSIIFKDGFITYADFKDLQYWLTGSGIAVYINSSKINGRTLIGPIADSEQLKKSQISFYKKDTYIKNKKY